MINYRNIEKDVDKKFEEVLLNMGSEELTEYFNQLIEKYYSAVFSSEEDFDKHVKDANVKYDNIDKVKNILKERFSIDDIEENIKLRHVERIAYNQMKELNYMEAQYSNIIYYNATHELIVINENLIDLIDLYKKEPSQGIISLIETTLLRNIFLIKEIKKLPLNEIDIENSFKENSEKHIEIKSKLKIPILSLDLQKQLKRFEKIFKDLKKILPKGSAIELENILYSSEKIELIKLMLQFKTEKQSEAEIYKKIAAIDYILNCNDETHLYGFINRFGLESSEL